MKTPPPPKPWVLLLSAGLLLCAHLVKDVLGHDAGHFGNVLAAWFEPVTFLACGLAVLWRAPRAERPISWFLAGSGLTLYAGGSIYYNLAVADASTPPFPSLADWMWLSLYPLSFASLATLVHGRFKNLTAAVWLDGMICGGVVAATVAAIVFNSVFDVTIASGAASIARLAYPVGDLVMVGVVIAVWNVSGRRLSPLWASLGVGFCLLALGDSAYVVEAAHGTWAPGNGLDYPYALGTMLIAAAAWLRAPEPRLISATERTGVRVPVISGLAALTLVTVAVLVGLNPLATVLSLVTMLAVVMRLGSTLARVNRQSRELAALAAADPLTGLPNHRTVHERLAQELRRAKGIAAPLSVVALDIDHFKSLNDTYGHTEGDAALQAIASVLSEHVSGRQLVGRVGGEEFVLVLPEVEPEDAVALAERCRAALSGLSVHGAGLSCSAGVASFPADDKSGSRLLELADGALYWAKRAGRGQTRRYDPREVILLSSAEQRAQVRAVIDSDEAITPVFQPIVELATGRVAGYEALTRFTGAEPRRPPDLWFAQARRCGLGAALEAKAIATALGIPGRPQGAFLSLNVSPAALVSPEVAAVLPEDLTDIVIELTEDEVFSSDVILDATLAELRERGARIAVDDAGAGYAGLQQVVRVAPEILKIDRSLITGIDSDASKMALVEALARFASTTGAAVCGEGIETVEELRMLARADATYAQGYALAKPGKAWPQVDGTVSGLTAAKLSMGMRVPHVEDGAPLSVGDVAWALARAGSHEELDSAIEMVKWLLHADDAIVSRVLSSARCVETMTANEYGTRYSFDDYPTTAHVIEDQVVGQLVVDDPDADEAERRLLEDDGFAALLMVPVISRAQAIGLLEVSRRAGRPWTSVEIDRARVLAQSLTGLIATHSEADALPWSPEAFERRLIDR